MEDWKDALAALRSSADFPEDDNEGTSETATDQQMADSKPRKKLKLQYFYEKKGRAGKPATIIAGFGKMTDEEISDIARRLKQRLGCGGSCRGGEILLQGDRRQQARELLDDWL